MISWINANQSQVVLQYSTPSDYLDALNKANIEWPTRYDDLFPYADSKNSYWTGYFSTRLSGKKYIRDASAASYAS